MNRKLSNLGIASETFVLTDNGSVEVQSIANKEVNVWNGTKWTAMTFINTGNKDILRSIKYIPRKRQKGSSKWICDFKDENGILYCTNTTKIVLFRGTPNMLNIEDNALLYPEQTDKYSIHTAIDDMDCCTIVYPWTDDSNYEHGAYIYHIIRHTFHRFPHLTNIHKNRIDDIYSCYETDNNQCVLNNVLVSW